MAPEDSSVRPIRILVVDDSDVVRQVLEAVLSQERDMLVMVAADPLIAQQKMARVRPRTWPAMMRITRGASKADCTPI